MFLRRWSIFITTNYVFKASGFSKKSYAQYARLILTRSVSDGNASKLLITRFGRFVRRLNYGRAFASGPRTKRFMYETVNVYSVGSLNYAIKASRKAESLRTIAVVSFSLCFYSGAKVV